MAQGTASLNFGSFPGSSDATVAVTGQTGILSGSLVEAWILPAATADHTADEHVVAPPRVTAGLIVAGVGFTIYGINDDRLGGSRLYGPNNTLVYGIWNVAWVWN